MQFQAKQSLLMSKNLSILIAEDDPADADLLVRQFKQAGYSVTAERVQTADALNAALHNQRWDLMLSDFRMPQFTAIDALHLLKQSGNDVPFILISGAIGEEAAVEAMKAGAHDYFPKGKYTRLVQSAEREMREAEERQKRRTAERNLNFLIEAGQVLSSSLDYEATLANLTRLVVPALADWCAVYLVEKGETRQVASLTSDPAKAAALQGLFNDYPVDPASPVGYAKVIRTGEPEFIPEIPPELIARAAVNDLHRERLQAIGMRSYISVPIRLRGQVFGAITLAAAESGRVYDTANLALADAFAQRASVAIENALLYREAAEQREWFEVTLRSIGDAVIATDMEGKITFMNQVAQTLTAWPISEAQGHVLEDVFHIVNEETRNIVENPVAKVIADGLVVGLANHTVLLDKNGQEYPIDDSGAPIRDRQGRMIGVVLVFHDVSEQRRAEQHIRQSEERYRAFIENSSEGIWRFDLDQPVATHLPISDQIDLFYKHGFLAECNDAMARMYGYQRAEEITGARLGDFLPRDKTDNIEYLTAFIQEGYRLSNAESQEVDRNNTICYFLNNLSGIIADGHIRGAWGIQRDVTELRESRVRLEHSYQRTRHLYELSRKISTTNTTQQVLEAMLSSHLLQSAKRATVMWFEHPWLEDNEPEYGDILAVWSRDDDLPDLTGRRFTFDDYKNRELVSRSNPVIVANTETDQRIGSETQAYLRQMGTKSYISLPLVAAGQFFGLITMHWDTPNAVSYEEASYLQGISDQAAAAIYNLQILEQEAQARRMAEEADALKMQFLAMISHELRTPLTSIKGFISSLLATDVTWDAEQQHEFHRIINTETDNLAELVEQLLDLSRLEAGTLSIQRSPISIPEMIEATLPKMLQLCDDHPVRREIAASLPLVLADQRRVTQVLTNLVDNACKYSPEGTEVIVSGREDGEMVRLTVRDHGPGIPAEERESVFEAFRQANNRPAHEIRGAGLGLAIAKALIEAHDGRIWIEESGGPGTAISFTLPVIRS